MYKTQKIRALLITIMTPLLLTQAFAMQIPTSSTTHKNMSLAVQNLHKKITRRTEAYNSIPKQASIPRYTFEINSIYKNSPSNNHANDDEREAVIKGLMFTAAIHHTAMPLNIPTQTSIGTLNASQKHYAIIQAAYALSRDYFITRTLTQENAQYQNDDRYHVLKDYAGLDQTKIDGWLEYTWQQLSAGFSKPEAAYWREQSNCDNALTGKKAIALNEESTASATDYENSKSPATENKTNNRGVNYRSLYYSNKPQHRNMSSSFYDQTPEEKEAEAQAKKEKEKQDAIVRERQQEVYEKLRSQRDTEAQADKERSENQKRLQKQEAEARKQKAKELRIQRKQEAEARRLEAEELRIQREQKAEAQRLKAEELRIQQEQEAAEQRKKERELNWQKRLDQEAAYRAYSAHRNSISEDSLKYSIQKGADNIEYIIIDGYDKPESLDLYYFIYLRKAQERGQGEHESIMQYHVLRNPPKLKGIHFCTKVGRYLKSVSHYDTIEPTPEELYEFKIFDEFRKNVGEILAKKYASDPDKQTW